MKSTISTFLGIGIAVLAIGYFLYNVGWKAIDGVSNTTTSTISSGVQQQTQTASATTP